MLRVIAAATAEAACTTVVDDYIALVWRCADTPPPVYWRTGDLTRSLLEVGLVPQSGRLCKVTVVSATGCLQPDDGVTAAYLAAATVREGLPCCDIRPWLDQHAWPDMNSWEKQSDAWMVDHLRWEEHVIDEPGPFTITSGAAGVSLWLGDPSPLAACYVTPTVRCGVNATGHLHLLHFDGLRDDERAHLVTTISGT